MLFRSSITRCPARSHLWPLPRMWKALTSSTGSSGSLPSQLAALQEKVRPISRSCGPPSWTPLTLVPSSRSTRRLLAQQALPFLPKSSPWLHRSDAVPLTRSCRSSPSPRRSTSFAIRALFSILRSSSPLHQLKKPRTVGTRTRGAGWRTGWSLSRALRVVRPFAVLQRAS